jgi:hypothetical protein
VAEFLPSVSVLKEATATEDENSFAVVVLRILRILRILVCRNPRKIKGVQGLS